MVKLGSYTVSIISETPGAVVQECADGVFELRDGTEYKVSLRNDSGRRAAAELRIDGIYMGLFLVNAHSSWAIERPDNDAHAKVFRFDAVGGSNATRAGAVAGESTNGLISVAFTPEKPRPMPTYRHRRGCVDVSWDESEPRGPPPCAAGAGGIGLFADLAESSATDGFGGAAAQSCAVASRSCMPPAPPAPAAVPRRSERREGVTTLGRESSQRFTTVDDFEGSYDETVTIHARLAVVAPPPVVPAVTPLSAVRGPRSTPISTPIPPPVAAGPPPPYASAVSYPVWR